MGAIRTTQGLFVDRVLNNLNSQSRRILDLQTQLATGRRINKPSDDPLDMRLAANTRTSIQRNDQFLENISTASTPLREATTTVESLVDVFQRARELALQGGSGTYGQNQLDAIAEEADQLLEHTVSLGNHIANGRYIFAGTRTQSEAFSTQRSAQGEIESVTYEGNEEHVELDAGDNVDIVINETGSQVFQANQDAFDTLIRFRDALRAGDQATIQNDIISDIETVADQFNASLSRVGAIENRLERLENDTDQFNFQLEEQRSNVLDADFAEVMINLNAQNNAFQAALNSGARVIQLSLLDFVR